MRVLCTRVDLELAELVGSERILGEHATNSLLDGARRVLFEEFGVLDGRQSSRVTRVAVGELLSELRTSESDLFGIDDDDMVTHVHVLSESRFVLAAKKNRGVASQTTEDNVFGVDDDPFPLDVSRFW